MDERTSSQDIIKNLGGDKLYCVFDLETTGLPKKRNGTFASYNNLEMYNDARIVSIACIFYNYENQPIKSFNFIRMPENFIWHKDAEKIHKITEEHALLYGLKIGDIIEQLELFFRQTTLLVAHNIEFDFNVLRSELYRTQNSMLDVISGIPTYCTMINGKNITKKISTYGYSDYMYPKLVELYKCVTNKMHPNPHDALSDCMVTAEIFQIIYLKDYKNIKTYPYK